MCQGSKCLFEGELCIVAEEQASNKYFGYTEVEVNSYFIPVSAKRRKAPKGCFKEVKHGKTLAEKLVV